MNVDEISQLYCVSVAVSINVLTSEIIFPKVSPAATLAWAWTESTRKAPELTTLAQSGLLVTSWANWIAWVAMQ